MQNEQKKSDMEGLIFSFWSGIYDQIVSIVGYGSEFRNENLYIARIRKGRQKILDIGCGTGELTLEVAKKAGSEAIVIGLDPEPRMLAVAQQKLRTFESNKNLELKVIFREGTIESIPYETGTFDKVLCTMVTHHLDRSLKYRGFREIHRVLKKKGYFINADFGFVLKNNGLSISQKLKFICFLYFNALETILGNYIETVEDNFSGVLPKLLKKVGFSNIRFLNSRARWTIYTIAQKI